MPEHHTGAAPSPKSNEGQEGLTETTNKGKELQAYTHHTPPALGATWHGTGKGTCPAPLPSRAPSPIAPTPVPWLLQRSRAIDFPASPFKTLLAQCPVHIIYSLRSKISLLLLQLFPNQHRSGLRQSEGEAPTSESMGSPCPGGCQGLGGRCWQPLSGRAGRGWGTPGTPPCDAMAGMVAVLCLC